MSTIRRWSVVCAWLVLGFSLASKAALSADEPTVSRLYVASDLPRLGRGFRLPRSGEYTVKVWAPRREKWTVSAEGQTLTLAMTVDGDDPRPAWQPVGKASLSADSSVTVVVAGLILSQTKEASKPGEKRTEPAKPVPIPSMVCFSTDAAFEPSHALDIARGNVETTAPPKDPRRTTVRSNQQGANFRAPASAQAWRDRARAVREQMLVALGLWPMPPKTPLNPQIYGKVERDGYTIEKVTLETLPGFTLAGNLYRPIGKTGKIPGLLCPHGHWEDGRVNPEVQARCIHWAKLGCAVFMYDMVGYNDSKAFGHAFLNDHLRRWGYSLASLQTWNSIRALDWLTSLPDVDVARIGCTGESGGGTQTFLLTALDDRIKVAAPVVMVSDSFQGGCVCENAAGLRFGTDNVEFAAMTAPRPLKLVGASGDWTAKTMSNAFPVIRDVYALVGQPERVSADVFDFPHNYNQTTRNAVYAYMARWLLGTEDPESTKETAQSPEKPEGLWAYNSDHPAPSGTKTPAELEKDLIATLAKQIDELRPKESAEWWQSDSSLLRTSLKVRVGLIEPALADLASREVRRVTREGLTIVHSAVGRKATGEEIAVVRLNPVHPAGRLTVILNSHGKAGLVTADGKPSPLAQALLDRGQVVVGFDPLLVGESVDASAFAERRPNTAHFETYNPALAGDRAQDLATVLAWARSQPDALEVSLIGQGSAGPLALIARPVLTGLARTVVDLNEFDYGDGSGEIPMGLDLPGVLQFGGLKSAAALTAPAPLWVVRAGSNFDASWARRAYELADSPGVLRIDGTNATPEAIARWLDRGER
jgi:hypothetical protein